MVALTAGAGLAGLAEFAVVAGRRGREPNADWNWLRGGFEGCEERAAQSACPM